MSGLVRQMIDFSKPKLWMWVLNAVLSTAITYFVLAGIGATKISNQLFMKYPFLFLCVVLIYLSCVLGILLMEMSVMWCYRVCKKMEHFEEYSQIQNASPSMIRVLKSNQKFPDILTAYQQTLFDIGTVNHENTENWEMPESIPFSMDILKMLNFTAILEDEDFSPEESIRNVRENFLIKLHQELETDFVGKYLSRKSDMQIMELLSQNPVFCEYTLPKMRRLSNDLEFILRLFSYLVADWCIDVYSRVYGVNKNIFFVNENNSEYENTVGKLNAFKNNLLAGHADVSNIIIYGFSAEKREIRAIRGELFEIYQNCSAILKQ